MATTKIWKVEKRLDHVVDYAKDKNKTKNDYRENGFDKYDNIRQVVMYATNADKTEKQFYTTGINCNVDEAVEQMQLVKKIYNKENGILAFHAEQSFAEGEVTPEMAHEIGVKLANEIWGDRFQVIVTTHLNTKHLHNHFVINSVSFKDGLKYYSNHVNTAILRRTSDELCDEYGISVLEEKTCKSGINYNNFYQKSLQNSDYYKFAKEDIDYAIKHSYSNRDFHRILNSMGYSFYYRAGKLSIRKEPHKRNIRVERAFGEDYSEENIRRRILANEYVYEGKIYPYKKISGIFYCRKGIFKKVYKPKGIVALYYYYRHLLGFYKKNNVPHKLTEQMRKDIAKMEHYSELIRFLCRYKLEKTENVYELKDKKLQEKQEILNARNRLYYKRGKGENQSEKDKITKLIIQVTEELNKVKKEIKMCDEVVDNSDKMKVQIRKVEEKEHNKGKKAKMRTYEL